MRKGLSEAQVEAALGDLERADLPAKTVAALRLVDLLSAPQPMIDTATYQRLREHLDDRELLELGAALSVASGWQRFIEAFGIRPDSWTEAMSLPWHEGTSRQAPPIPASHPTSGVWDHAKSTDQTIRR
jgi:hypothetical protein